MMLHGTPRSGRAALYFALLLLATASLGSIGWTRFATLRGTTYEATYVTRVSGDSTLSAAMESLGAEWTAHVTVAGGRGRLDVTGGKPPGFAIGDFILFDATGSVVVRPATREAVITLPDTQVLKAAFATAGMRSSIDSVTSNMDSGAVVELVGGRKATTWQTRLSYRMVMQFDSLPEGVVMPSMSSTTTMITRYWFGEADTGNVVAPMFGSASVSPMLAAKTMSSMGGPLAEAQIALAAKMPRLPILKSQMVVETSASGRRSRIEFLTEQSGWKSESVEPRNLILPAEYRLVVSGKPHVTAADSAHFKHWRTPPG